MQSIQDGLSICPFIDANEQVFMEALQLITPLVHQMIYEKDSFPLLALTRHRPLLPSLNRSSRLPHFQHSSPGRSRMGSDSFLQTAQRAAVEQTVHCYFLRDACQDR